MRVLITGVAGHIGSALARWILDLQEGVQIVGVDDLSCGYRDNVPQDVEFWEGDAGQIPFSYWERPFDAVFHLAAYAAECMSPFCREFNYRNNVLPLANIVTRLIDSDASHGRIVFASSMAVYGHSLPCPLDERMRALPGDPYGVAKLACEQDLRIAGEQHGVDWCVVRPHNVYGPGQSLWQRYRNVVALWMRALLEGDELTVFGDGEQTRAFSYVGDLVPALWAAATRESASGQVINVGGAQPVTLNELLVELRVATGRPIAVTHAPARHEAKHAWCTSVLAQSVLGYSDRTALRDGLREAWRWSIDAWRRWPERRDRLCWPTPETTRGMPEAWRRDFEPAGGEAGAKR